jgi:hypothetical protein
VPDWTKATERPDATSPSPQRRRVGAMRSEPASRAPPGAGSEGGAAAIVSAEKSDPLRRGALAIAMVEVPPTEGRAQCGFNNRASALMTENAP